MVRAASDDNLQLLTVKQAASKLGCSPSNVYALIEAGELAIVQVGQRKGYRIDLRDLEAFVAARKFSYQAPRPKPTSSRLKHIKL